MPVQTSERYVTLKSSEGAVFTEPLPSWLFSQEKQCRIILVHGYNNSESEAFESYERFRTFCSEYSGYYGAKVFYLIWSGDEFNNLLKWFDDNTKNAQLSGRNLGSFLARVISAPYDQDCQFVIIAHSLGCRLVAEMLKELHKINQSLCSQFRLFLMAGAIRSDDIDAGNNFGQAFATADRVVNFYSPKDHVLKRYFPLGELGGGRRPVEAIGLNSDPREFKSWQPQLMEGFDHGDYWKEKSVVEVVLKALGVAVPTTLPTNRITSYRLPEHLWT